MAEKKFDRRFTIQFSKSDPAHRRVADILNQLEWRGKAQYIVNAVLYYVSRGEPEVLVSSVIDERHIEAVVNRLLRDKENSGIGILPISATAYLPVGTDETLQHDADVMIDEVAEALGDVGLDSITGALEMFRKK